MEDEEQDRKRNQMDGEIDRECPAQKSAEDIAMLIQRVHFCRLCKGAFGQNKGNECVDSWIENENGQCAQECQLEAELDGRQGIEKQFDAHADP